jgi:hypothetical protein
MTLPSQTGNYCTYLGFCPVYTFNGVLAEDVSKGGCSRESGEDCVKEELWGGVTEQDRGVHMLEILE